MTPSSLFSVSDVVGEPRLSVTFLDVVTEWQEATEGRKDVVWGIAWRDIVHQSGKDLVARAWGYWSPCLCSAEAKSEEYWQCTYFLLLIQCGAWAHAWFHPHSRPISFISLETPSKSFQEVSSVILTLAKRDEEDPSTLWYDFPHKYQNFRTHCGLHPQFFTLVSEYLTLLVNGLIKYNCFLYQFIQW